MPRRAEPRAEPCRFPFRQARLLPSATRRGSLNNTPVSTKPMGSHPCSGSGKAGRHSTGVTDPGFASVDLLLQSSSDVFLQPS